jgi:hypothetical protein
MTAVEEMEMDVSGETFDVFSLAGISCAISSKDSQLRHILSVASPAECSKVRCHLHVAVGDGDTQRGPLHVRGAHHIVWVTFGASNVFLFDLLRCRITARVTPSLARDRAFWEDEFMPLASGLCGSAIGLLPAHSACLSFGDCGLLLAGQSGAGKSTLALALALRGMELLNDEWSYCSLRDGRLRVHAWNTPLKLLPDAVQYFPPLALLTPMRAMNGEIAIEFDPGRLFQRVRRRRSCAPRAIVFYERKPHGPSSLVVQDDAFVREYFEASLEQLPDCLGGAQQTRRSLVTAISRLPCWRFASAYKPKRAALELSQFFREQFCREGSK